MKILSDIGFLIKVILISAAIGFALGFYVGERAHAHTASESARVSAGCLVGGDGAESPIADSTTPARRTRGASS